MFKLVIQDDEGKTTVVPLIRDEITIGRKEGNTIRLTERNVSRRHARILRSNGEVQIEDLGSYNGIRVNNARIAERVSLRVSDQVQIGDYKLYLKAEGVEQVDDARTMPIERVETGSQNAATDVISAVAPAPTQPMGIPATPSPGTGAAGGRLVGDPNRTLVSVADTDPQGRPVASAATVAALTAPVGYGKLVVLSNNFAGTEFELSRPQMIIGRTDENDIVVAHRSISRNHAKLVREPDSGRYTISDLQSSNGVRVNGQDYGKVELRRGDVIDLGHVRFRFVEPGEDFLLGRDAVITDVPDVGGKRGVVVGVIAAVVLVAVIVVLVLRTMAGGKETTVQGSGSEGSNVPIVATIEDAKEPAVVPPPPVEIDAAPQTPVKPPNEDAKQLTDTCLKAQSDERWDDLIDCAVKLKALDPTRAAELTAAGNREVSTQPERTRFDEAIGRNVNDVRAAKRALDIMQQQGSVYYDRYRKKYEQAERASAEELGGRLKRLINRDCKDYNQLVKSEIEARGKTIVDLAKQRAGTCTPVKTDPCKQDPKPPGCGETVQPPTEKCDAADLQTKGTDAYAGGSYSQALRFFENAYKCKADAMLAQRAFMAACKLANRDRAKYYFKKAPSEAEKALSICVGLGITKDELLAP